MRIEDLTLLVDYHEAVHQLTLDVPRAASTPTSSDRVVDSTGTRRSPPACAWSA